MLDAGWHVLGSARLARFAPLAPKLPDFSSAIVS